MLINNKSNNSILEVKELTKVYYQKKKTLEAYEVWQTKKMYGKEFKGISRTTYLIDPNGLIAFIWTKVKPDGHADEVLEKIQVLKK